MPSPPETGTLFRHAQVLDQRDDGPNIVEHGSMSYDDIRAHKIHKRQPSTVSIGEDRRLVTLAWTWPSKPVRHVIIMHNGYMLFTVGGPDDSGIFIEGEERALMEKLPELGEVKIIKEGDWTRRYFGYWPEDYPADDPDQPLAPACQHPDGSFEYWRNRVYHRPEEEGPAFHYFHESPTGKKLEHIEYRFEGNLHCTFGPACFRKGDWKSEIAKQTTIYAFFGINVPPDWTEELTTEKILAERNAEVRRVGVEVYGIEKFVEETIKETIDADIDDRNDARALVKLQDDTLWLVATDGSTGRVYHLRVPDNTETCAQAHKALTGLNDEKCLGAG